MLKQITLESAILRDQLGQELHRSQFNMYEMKIGEHGTKLDRLETFNRELRSKVDYFIGIIQQLSLSPVSNATPSSI